MNGERVKSRRDKREDAREREYKSIVKALPTRAAIFLPTEKFNIDERLTGIRRVQDIYFNRLDSIYRPKLRALRERYKGTKRCFIIGNGLSLNQTDLSVLKDEVTFAVNGFFLKAQDLDWRPTFYVVEDHLVAEDRRQWINDFKGPIKLFPAYLGYCLDEGDDTIFFNHRPRKSFPHGFDFSSDAAEVTYTGCTVTFTCMQLACYFGFEEIYLIGVDASYDLPEDVQRGDAYAVGVLDMKSDDPNHFHPDYFGKGFRWHDPQVDKMIAAYQEARRVTEPTRQGIYNATIGGKLEVFERRGFSTLFPNTRAPEELEEEKQRSASSDIPRLLVLDITAQGDGTATGELKSNIFAEWPNDRYLQIYHKGHERLGIQRGPRTDERTFDYLKDFDELLDIIDSFRPELILYRPVPDSRAHHAFAMQVVASRLHIPLAVWIMDDWLSRLESEDPDRFANLNEDWLWLLECSQLRLSICDQMSAAFKERYGFNFVPFANGVDPADWPQPMPNPKPEFVIRYAGGLADNMTAQSVQRVAEAVEALAEEGHAIQLEIRTRATWKHKQESHYSKLKHTSFITCLLSEREYRKWLNTADAVLIAYNFDADSLRYIGLSLANKLPECLASGVPVIAHGPQAAATVAYLSSHDCALVLDVADIEHVKAGILKLQNEERRKQLSDRGREVAFMRHNIITIRRALTASLAEVAKLPGETGDKSRSAEEFGLDLGFPRSLQMTVNETSVIVRMLRDRRGRSHIMVDVGAQAGLSAPHFTDLGWTIYCSEPDPSNRAKIVDRLGKMPDGVIDQHAVEKPEQNQPFYTSQESSSISSRYAFRKTHRQTALVDVTSVAELVFQHGLSRIDYLKIDEELDFAVLRGVPWEIIKPEIIECEFDGTKTVRLGHSLNDVADYLIERGYTVYISEWHSIVRYGTRDWCRLIRYPGSLRAPATWGNLLAFREDPGLGVLRAAFAKSAYSRARHAVKAQEKTLAAVREELVAPNSSEALDVHSNARENATVLEETKKALHNCKKDLATSNQKLRTTRSALIANKNALDETKKALVNTRKELATSNQKLRTTRAALIANKNAIEDLRKALTKTKAALEISKIFVERKELVAPKKKMENATGKGLKKWMMSWF